MAVIDIEAYDGTATSDHVQLLARGVASPDIVTGGQTLDSGDEVVIEAKDNDDITLFILDTGGGAVVTIEAGDYPISPHASRGAATITIPSADGVLYTPVAGRHLKSDGTIVITSTEEVLVWCFRHDSGYKGVTYYNRTAIPAGDEL